jgi:hypothetical protein
VLGSRAQFQTATETLYSSAVRSGWARITYLATKEDPNRGIRRIRWFTPDHRVLTLGTGDLLIIPIDLEAGLVVSLFISRLPTGVGMGRPDQANSLLLLTLGEQDCVDVGRIHQMLSGGQTLLNQRLLDRLSLV